MAPRTIYVDQNVLLNDFFHRYPQYARQQSEALSDLRNMVHERLIQLSITPGVAVATATHQVLRLCSVISELGTPAEIVADELHHLLQNFILCTLNPPDIEHALAHHAKMPEIVPELWLILLAAKGADANYIFTLQPGLPHELEGIGLIGLQGPLPF